MALEVITRQPENQTHATPLLFVHGGWHAAWAWDEHFLPYFADQGYSVHALSLRGHGGSPNDKPLRTTRIKDYAADVLEVARSIQPRPVLIGHSMGGVVIQHALAEFEAPAGVLVAAIPLNVMPSVMVLLREQTRAFLEMNLKLSLWPLVSTPERVRWLFFSDSMPEDQLMQYYPRLQDEAYMVFPDIAFLARAQPHKVKSPMLVIGAGSDRFFTQAQIEGTARSYNTTARMFPNMAHDMMLEAGWQDVADCILGWLAERGI